MFSENSAPLKTDYDFELRSLIVASLLLELQKKSFCKALGGTLIRLQVTQNELRMRKI
jgi:hypothetical protein